MTPGAPWQKGGAENLNGMVRRYVPFELPAADIDDKMVQEVNEKMNNIPREILGFLSPIEFAQKYKEKKGEDNEAGHTGRGGIIKFQSEKFRCCTSCLTLPFTSQTEKHLLYSLNTYEYCKPNLFLNKKFFSKIHDKEKIELSNHNYVFYHGRKWHWHLLSDINKQLWNITKNDNIKDDYQFLRFGIPGTY